MSREWKPGDVGLIPFARTSEIGLYTDDGWVIPHDPRYPTKEFCDVRPLVVIDPEDAEGNRWVRDEAGGSEPRVWYRRGEESSRNYADVTAVRVLSEGVTS